MYVQVLLSLFRKTSKSTNDNFPYSVQYRGTNSRDLSYFEVSKSFGSLSVIFLQYKETVFVKFLQYKERVFVKFSPPFLWFKLIWTQDSWAKMFFFKRFMGLKMYIPPISASFLEIVLTPPVSVTLWRHDESDSSEQFLWWFLVAFEGIVSR